MPSHEADWPNNPATEIEHRALRTTKRPKRRSFSPEEMRTILEAVDLPRKKDTAPDLAFACLIHLLAHSGLRIGEALALAWKDIDFTAGSVRVTSTLVEAAGKVVPGVRRPSRPHVQFTSPRP